MRLRRLRMSWRRMEWGREQRRRISTTDEHGFKRRKKRERRGPKGKKIESPYVVSYKNLDMKSDKPKTPREELEASLTALLLGELPAEKAAALRELMAKDEELAKLYERLEQAIGLMRETTASSEEKTVAQPALKMSGKKREELLAHFKTVAPKEFEKAKRVSPKLLEIAAILLIVALLASLALPTLSTAKRRSFSANSAVSSRGRQQVSGQMDTLESAPAVTEMIARDAAMGQRPAAGPVFDNGQNGVVFSGGGGGGGIGRPSQNVFERSYGENHGEPQVAFSAGKPSASQIILPTVTDYDVSGKEQSVRLLASTNYISGDPQWPGILERENYSSPGHSSSDAFVSRYASIVVPSNALDLDDVAKLAYQPRVPVLVTNPSSTATSDFAYYSDLNRQGGFDTKRVPGFVASNSTLEAPKQLADAGFGLNGVAGNDEMYRRRYGGVAWDDKERSKQGNVAAESLRRSKLPEAAGEAQNVPLVDRATGLPVAASGSLGLVNGGGDPATGLPISVEDTPTVEMAPTPLQTRTVNVDSDSFHTALEPFMKDAAKQSASTGGTGGGGGGASPLATRSGLPTRTLQVPVQTAAAPATVLREKLADVAQKGKDASGSNIYLGTELVEADQNGFKFGEWGLQTGQPSGLPGARTEEEKLKQVDVPNGGVLDSEKASALGDLPMLGRAFNSGISTNDVQSPSNVYSASAVGYYNDTGLSRESPPRLNQASSNVASYDRYTFYRESGQLGTETNVSLNYATVGKKERASSPASEPEQSRALIRRDVATLSQELAGQQAKVSEAQAKVDRLREQYKIADATAGADAPTMLMTAETLRKLEGMRIELEAQTQQQETILEKLKEMPREKLVSALPTAVPDPLLSSLQEQKTLAENELVAKQKELGESSAEVARLRSQLKDLNSKIDQQADGILSNLDGRVTALKGQLGKLHDEVEKARTNDVANAKQAEPYWEAEDAQRFSQVLAMKIASEGIEASLPKTTMVEIMDPAVPPQTANAGLWDRLRGNGKFESLARVKVERDQSDVSFVADATKTSAYDPYFIQNEFEAIKSDKVLGNVVGAMDLRKQWAKGGRTLSTNEAIALLKQKLDLKTERNTSLVDIRVKDDKADEAAALANAVAKSYQVYRQAMRKELSVGGIKALEERWKEQETKVADAQREVDRLRAQTALRKAATSKVQAAPVQQVDAALAKPVTPPPVPQPEVQTRENAFSTFSLNVSDVAFKLAAASLEKGQMPEAGSIRSEEFINAFDYRDPEAVLPARGKTGVPVAFAWERARYPYAQNRDLLRFSIKTAAQGRQAGRPLNIVLLLDNSGSMERADRVAIIREALKVLASQLQAQDKLSVITFARTAQLRVDGVAGNQAARVAEEIGGLTPEGGTNIEEAMNLAYQTALRHYLANGINRVVLLTDGAANLGNVEPESLKQKVEANRKQGIALDCFGIGWEGFNDDLLETLSRNGDGRYGFINTPEEAATEFAGQLAGALNVAASDVKVQVEFNPARLTAYRQIGYAKHQLTKEQFRDNTVDAAEIAAQEAGNALYVIEVNPAGDGPLGTVRVRFKIPGTSDYREHEWAVPFNGNAVALEQASPAMRLAATASAFSEWLASSPYATEVTPDTLLRYLGGVAPLYRADARPKKLEWMIRQAKSVVGK